MDKEKCPVCNPFLAVLTQDKKNILETIQKSGSLGLSIKEIHEETQLPQSYIKKFLIKLREKGLIYHNYSEGRWRLLMYQREDEKDYNEKMRWCAT